MIIYLIKPFLSSSWKWWWWLAVSFFFSLSAFFLSFFFLHFVFCPMRLNSTVMWTFGEIEMILFLFLFYFSSLWCDFSESRNRCGENQDRRRTCHQACKMFLTFFACRDCIVVDTTDSQMVGGGERWLDILNTTPTAETPELLPGGGRRTWASVKFEEKAESFALFWVPLNIVEEWGGHPLWGNEM